MVVVADSIDEQGMILAASFTNGVLNTAQSERIGACIYQKTENVKTKKLVMSAGEMDYAGNFLSTRDEGKYVGVVDPDTNEMTLIPLKQVKLRPAVSIAGEVVEEAPEPKKSRQELNDSLIDTFGGAKQKQNLLRRKKHGINKDMIVDALDAAGMENVTVSAPSTPSTPRPDDNEEVLPPHDELTQDPDNAYPLDGYFPDKIRTELRSFVEDITDVNAETISEWRASKKYPLFVLNQLENLPLVESKRITSSVLIKYIAFLIHLYKARPATLRQKDPFGGDTFYSMPASCQAHLLRTYTGGNSMRNRTMSARLKDKVLIAIVLLALRLERNTLLCDVLITDLKVGMKKLVEVGKAMGCKIKMDKTKDVPSVVIQLAVPLKFPKAGGGRPKPKKR